ncbi:MAG: response regulator [Victivallales bacterium]|nr:response regulator [Victivallales bacterium]
MGALAGAKILVIEDMQELLIFHRRWLSIEKAEFYGSMTGEDGIRTFRETPDIELVMLDILLPDMDGLKVLQQLREINPDIPIVVCSGYNETMEELMKYPHVRFVGKPFVLPELRRIIVEMSGRQANAS